MAAQRTCKQEKKGGFSEADNLVVMLRPVLALTLAMSIALEQVGQGAKAAEIAEDWRQSEDGVGPGESTTTEHKAREG
jgi:hypothetical protein